MVCWMEEGDAVVGLALPGGEWAAVTGSVLFLIPISFAI